MENIDQISANCPAIIHLFWSRSHTRTSSLLLVESDFHRSLTSFSRHTKNLLLISLDILPVFLQFQLFSSLFNPTNIPKCVDKFYEWDLFASCKFQFQFLFFIFAFCPFSFLVFLILKKDVFYRFIDFNWQLEEREKKVENWTRRRVIYITVTSSMWYESAVAEGSISIRY